MTNADSTARPRRTAVLLIGLARAATGVWLLPPDRRRSTRRLAFGFAIIGALGASTLRPRAGTRGGPDREVR